MPSKQVEDSTRAGQPALLLDAKPTVCAAQQCLSGGARNTYTNQKGGRKAPEELHRMCRMRFTFLRTNIARRQAVDLARREIADVVKLPSGYTYGLM